MDEVAGVAVGDVEIAVGRHVEAGEQKLQLVAARVAHFEGVGNGRRPNRHDDRAIELHLHDRLAAQRRPVEELAVRLRANDESACVMATSA